ncbi:DUF4260 domain-containing protein [Aurantiacibacter flavus]|uniref:DUF4260 domain-containing protein n=1 Tax=Aurantiacibacter flavus TaxID=3145232 RepID=A0ABV0CZW9_9SPHN
MQGFVTGTPNLLLRAEATLVLVGAVAAYASLGSSWTLFALLILIPDVSILGFLAGPRVGAVTYNAAHWHGIPLSILGYGFSGHSPIMLDVGLIWIAHISFDRMIGAGLKYPDGFRFSHLGVYGAKKLANSRSSVGNPCLRQ